MKIVRIIFLFVIISSINCYSQIHLIPRPRIYCDTLINRSLYDLVEANNSYESQLFIDVITYSKLDSIIGSKNKAKLTIWKQDFTKLTSKDFYLKYRSIIINSNTSVSFDSIDRIELKDHIGFGYKLVYFVGMFAAGYVTGLWFESLDYLWGRDFEWYQPVVIGAFFSGSALSMPFEGVKITFKIK